MLLINLNKDSITLTDSYRLIKNTTTSKNRKGEEKKYIAYSCSFPYPFVEMWGNPSGVYFYEHLGRFYVSVEEPPSYYYNWKFVKLNNRKNSRQKSSRENDNKPWAKLITVPKTVMGEMDNSLWLVYTLHCNKEDFVTGEPGLLEVSLQHSTE